MSSNDDGMTPSAADCKHSIDMESMIPIAYKGVRALTSTLLSSFYETTEKSIRDNFGNNQDRFIEGKHFFKVFGPELASLKNNPDFISIVDPRAKDLILWTERGAARHAKMLNTERAWEIFERLEDAYFRRKIQAAAALPITEPRPLADWPLEEMRAKCAVWRQYERSFGMPAGRWIAQKMGFPLPPLGSLTPIQLTLSL